MSEIDMLIRGVYGTDDYPRSRKIRELIGSSRLDALIEFCKEQDFQGKKDWKKVKIRGREIAREKLDDLVSRQVRRITRS